VDEAEQDVLGPDVVVVEEPSFFLGQDDDPACSVGKAFEHLVLQTALVGGWKGWIGAKRGRLAGFGQSYRSEAYSPDRERPPRWVP
jgi:hypothetical protein